MQNRTDHAATPEDVTRCLCGAAAGDARAADELLSLLYAELRELARARLRKAPSGNTLQPTALVHEAYLKLIRDENAQWESRRHFFGAAAQAMRDLLVDQARRKASAKHGGDRKRVEFAADELNIEAPKGVDLVALDEALRRLESDDPRKGLIVSLRYFTGLSEVETAALLGLSDRQIRREWSYIKAWLKSELGNREADRKT